jgi:hypothetical protein
MLVNEEDFDALVEAVDNAQMRLADTFMLRVLAQLIDSVEEISEKVNHMYEFLSSDEDESAEQKEDDKVEESTIAKEEAKEEKAVKQPAKAKKSEEDSKPEAELEAK